MATNTMARAGLALGAVALAVLMLPASMGCRRAPSVPPSPPRRASGAAARDAGGRTATAEPFSRAAPLAGVVDPWLWPRARGASDRERAVEDIGPYEPAADRSERGDAALSLVNCNAEYWTTRVGLAWTRDVDIDFDGEPVDLDGDAVPDTWVTRHVHARGGVLANPATFGLVPTPDDPRGTVGRISVSTGVLGLREALTPDGRPSGQIGMTCFLCHGGAHPDDGRPVLGLPGTAFDYGLLLATAAVLDDRAPAAVAYRERHGFPSGRTVRARLLLAGPGRQDLTGEFGLDVTVPGIHSLRYPGTRRVRQGTSGIVNPISVPGAWAMGGLDLENWSGSEVASTTLVRRLAELTGAPELAASLEGLGLPPLADELEPTAGGDRLRGRRARAALAPLRRALLLDLRNLGTLGLQQDSYPGLLWADAVRARESLPVAALLAIPPMYAAAALRRVLDAAADAWNGERAEAGTRVAATRAQAIARGRALFSDRVVGRIANWQILKEAPEVYAAARLTGPVLAPLDPAMPPTFAVRCADCHSATPGGLLVSLDAMPPPLGRCSHCHHSHRPFGDEDGGATRATAGTATPAPLGARARRPLAELGVPASAAAEVAHCRACHDRHRSFTPVAFSSSALLPFDADRNGKAQDDELADADAGGIGTEALLAFDVPRPQRPRTGFGVTLPRLASLDAVAPVGTIQLGAGWVRVAPLVALRASAPYLHNGSVPTLRALLEPAARRPTRFPLGPTGFRFDTRLPGNRNVGHEFGTRLSASEKRDLVAFLESL